MTLSPQQHAALAAHWQVFRRHYPVGAGIVGTTDDGNCFECPTERWPCARVAPLIAEAMTPEENREAPAP